METEAGLKKIGDEIKDWILANPSLGITENSLTIKTNEETGKLEADIFTVRYADRKTTKLSTEFTKKSEIVELLSLWKSIQSVSKLPVNVKIGAAEQSFETYAEFYDHIMEASKKGQYIQRYKGLGEMNPEQLWETTLNPENRSLLQVTIDDALAADETFSVLMGEQVEPRRQFIHDNALFVKSLDV